MSTIQLDHADHENVPITDCFHIRKHLYDLSRDAPGMSEEATEIASLFRGLDVLNGIDVRMSIRQWRIILFLYQRGEPVQVMELQEALGLPASTLSRMLAFLSGIPTGYARKIQVEPPFWVVLHTDSEDRRRTLVDLTPERRQAILLAFTEGSAPG